MQDSIEFDKIDKDGPQTYKRTYEATAEELGQDEFANGGPVSIDVTVRKGEQPAEYVADGGVQFHADLNCARCAEPYPFASHSTFHLRFRPRPEAAGEEAEEVEISNEELDVEFYTERSIPLRELATEQIQLSIPMKPLCDENCLGLCPGCGINRNRETCNCESSIVDERWGTLKEFREGLLKKRES